MLGEFKEGEILVQLAILDNDRILNDGRREIFVNDGNGHATRPLKIDSAEFRRQFRPWGEYNNVFVRAVKIIAFENEGKMVRFQRLDKNNHPIGDTQLTKKDIFGKTYMLEHQIVI